MAYHQKRWTTGELDRAARRVEQGVPVDTVAVSLRCSDSRLAVKLREHKGPDWYAKHVRDGGHRYVGG